MIQTIGRSARNVNAKVILYGDKVTVAMKNAIEETERRRRIQQAYNEEHNIVPRTVEKNSQASIASELDAHREATEVVSSTKEKVYITEEYIGELQTEMLKAAEDLDFEKAAQLRDQIGQLKNNIGQPLSAVKETKSSTKRGRRGRRRRGSKVPRPRKRD